MRFRAATRADQPRVQEIIFRALRSYGLKPDPEDTDADLFDLEGYYSSRGGIFEVLEDDEGNVVGSFGLIPTQEGRCELRKMYLPAEYRGRGWGKLLLERSFQRARELGFKRMELETASVLCEAVALYRKFGFEEVARPLHASRCDLLLERKL